METSSLESSKIGLKVVRDSMSKLESLKDDINKQISDLENNFTQN